VQEALLTISDIYGHQVARYLLPTGKSSFNFSTTGLPSGIYFFKVTLDKKEAFAGKLAIVH